MAPAWSRRAGNPLIDWEDDRLVAACLEGSHEAWEELVERYGRLVYSVSRRCGLDDADASEVFQNVFVVLFRRLELLRQPRCLAAWLVRTTSRECYRVAAARREIASEPGAAAGAETDDTAAIERQQVVRQAMRRLGGRCEQLLRLLFLAPSEPSYQDIARELNMRMGSIGPTRARCFSKLKSILREMGFGG
jgi:RNA polymerase sigma factor (sigma-70 family)